MTKLSECTQVQLLSNAATVGDSVPVTNVGFKQNKIITEKFMKELPSIKKMRGGFTDFSSIKKQIFSSTKDFTDILVDVGNEKTPLTNISGFIPIFEGSEIGNHYNTKELTVSDSKEEHILQSKGSATSDSKAKNGSIKKLENENNELVKDETESDTLNLLDVQPKFLKTEVVFKTDACESKHGSSVSTMAPDNHLSPKCVDLSTVIVPVSLQYKEDKLILFPLVQDVRQMYYKTSDVMIDWHLLARSKGQLWYTAVDEFLKQPNNPQSSIKEKAIAKITDLKDNTSAWLCEVKEKSESTAKSGLNKPEQKSAEALEGSRTEKLNSVLGKFYEAIKHTLTKRKEDKKGKEK